METRASHSPLLRAIRMVESGGVERPRDGDGGRAIGEYQIWHSYWQDSRVPGFYRQCRERAYAERVVLAYLSRYCPAALAAGDWRACANMHHLGATAARRGEVDERYLEKVKASLEVRT